MTTILRPPLPQQAYSAGLISGLWLSAMARHQANAKYQQAAQAWPNDHFHSVRMPCWTGWTALRETVGSFVRRKWYNCLTGVGASHSDSSSPSDMRVASRTDKVVNNQPKQRKRGFDRHKSIREKWA